MLPEMMTFVLHKLIVALIVILFLVFFDRRYLRGFETREVLRDNPVAIAVLLSGVAVAVALA